MNIRFSIFLAILEILLLLHLKYLDTPDFLSRAFTAMDLLVENQFLKLDN